MAREDSTMVRYAAAFSALFVALVILSIAGLDVGTGAAGMAASFVAAMWFYREKRNAR
jgi:hypothetical protein